MNMPESQGDVEHRVDSRIDTLMEKLDALSMQVDIAAERLAREDITRVRRALRQKKDEEGG